MHAKTHLSLALLVALTACGQDKVDEPPAAPQADAPAPSQGAAIPESSLSPMDAALEAGRIRYGSICAGCHGKNGEGVGTFPRVAGKPAQELAAKLRDYRDGKTMGEQTAIMAPNAQSLNDEDIDALANYMASLKG